MKVHEIFVSPNGSDLNDGSLSYPLRTPDAARRKVLFLKPDGKVNVYFRGGDYLCNLSLSSDDSGTSDFPITYSAYKNEKVRFLGGFKVEANRFFRVKDKKVLSRIIDEDAKKRLVGIDLSDKKDLLYPITNNYEQYTPTAIFSNDSIMDLARYPKRIDGKPHVFGTYARSEIVYYEGDSKRPIDIPIKEETARRISMWDKSAVKDLWIGGYFGQNWLDETHKLIKIDPENRTITTDDHGFRSLPPKEEKRSMRFYFFNILDEISKSSEYYVDYEKGYVYICPDDPDHIPAVYIGESNAPLLEIMDAHDIEIKNIEFCYTHGEMSKIYFSNNIVIDGCKFAHGASTCMTVNKSSRVSVLNCDIYDFCLGGIFIQACGEKYRVISSEIVVDNCIIHDVAKTMQCYTPCIKTDSIGVSITHNTLYNSPHNLIGLGWAQNVTVAYNDLHDSVADSDDASVIYWGRLPITIGMVIHDNYFHDNGNENATFGNFAIYQDDLTTGADIYNNVFYKTSYPETACVIMGAEFHHAHNNIFIAKRTDYGYWQGGNGDAWALSCAGAYTPNRHNRFIWGSILKWHEILEHAGFFGDYWRAYYKNTQWQQMYDILKDDAVAALQEYKKTILDDPDELQNAKLRYKGLDLFWSHKLRDGEIYEGSVWDMIKERYPEEYKKAIDETEGKSEADRLHRLCQLEWKLCDRQDIVADYTVFYDGNLTCGVRMDYRFIPGAHNKNNFDMDSHYMPNGKSLFVDFGKDFTMTEEAVKYVKENIEGFEPIDMTKIGAKR